MISILQQAYTSYIDFIGDKYYWGIFILCVICLLFVCKKQYHRRYTFFSILLYIVVYAFPVSAKFLMDYGMGREVYWRMFWIIPIPMIMAWSITELLFHLKGKRRLLLVTVISLILVITGTCVYANGNYESFQNYYKVPDKVINVCNIINDDANTNQITYKRAACMNELVPYVRQYDATIQLSYGRNALRHEPLSVTAQNLFDSINTENKDWTLIAENLRADRCNYFVCYEDDAVAGQLSELGFALIGNTDGYNIFRDTYYTITQYSSTSGSQSLIYTVEDASGRFMIIDGGWESDAQQLRQIIEAHDNKVDAWVITHPHQDHVGAFNVLMGESDTPIRVGHIYASDFDDSNYHKEAQEWDNIENYDKFLNVTKNMENVTFLKKGDELQVIGLKMEVYSSYSNKIGVEAVSAANDGSLMFKLSASTQSILFCGDVGSQMAPKILEEWKDQLSADYIQMGHHGNGGLTEEFYRNVHPTIAFFDAPEWLMYPAEGTSYTTPENREIMESMGAQILWYSTTPNRVELR